MVNETTRIANVQRFINDSIVVVLKQPCERQGVSPPRKLRFNDAWIRRSEEHGGLTPSRSPLECMAETLFSADFHGLAMPE